MRRAWRAACVRLPNEERSRARAPRSVLDVPYDELIRDPLALLPLISPQPVREFFKGDAGGSTDPRTHIAKRNEPFTQQGWNGRKFDMVLGGVVDPTTSPAPRSR